MYINFYLTNKNLSNIIKVMEENELKLIRLYNECINELKSIGIDVLNKDIGEIDIKLTYRAKKRYGCCKQENPGKRYFKKYHIEISNWVMDLDEKIIKNTIMHEIIHCLPNCNNHGEYFKKYANYINQKLGYNISRLGNKEQDFKNSNLDYIEKAPTYNYKIICPKCGQEFFRQRINKNFARKYRCGKCGGKFEVYKFV